MSRRSLLTPSTANSTHVSTLGSVGSRHSNSEPQQQHHPSSSNESPSRPLQQPLHRRPGTTTTTTRNTTATAATTATSSIMAAATMTSTRNSAHQQLMAIPVTTRSFEEIDNGAEEDQSIATMTTMNEITLQDISRVRVERANARSQHSYGTNNDENSTDAMQGSADGLEGEDEAEEGANDGNNHSTDATNLALLLGGSTGAIAGDPQGSSQNPLLSIHHQTAATTAGLRETGVARAASSATLLQESLLQRLDRASEPIPKAASDTQPDFLYEVVSPSPSTSSPSPLSSKMIRRPYKTKRSSDTTTTTTTTDGPLLPPVESATTNRKGNNNDDQQDDDDDDGADDEPDIDYEVATT